MDLKTAQRRHAQFIYTYNNTPSQELGGLTRTQAWAQQEAERPLFFPPLQQVVRGLLTASKSYLCSSAGVRIHDTKLGLVGRYRGDCLKDAVGRKVVVRWLSYDPTSIFVFLHSNGTYLGVASSNPSEAQQRQMLADRREGARDARNLARDAAELIVAKSHEEHAEHQALAFPDVHGHTSATDIAGHRTTAPGEPAARAEPTGPDSTPDNPAPASPATRHKRHRSKKDTRDVTSTLARSSRQTRLANLKAATKPAHQTAALSAHEDHR